MSSNLCERCGTYGFQDCTCACLTFAEALTELRAGRDVEWKRNHGAAEWERFSEETHAKLGAFTNAEWRRIRPKRSRVQEMAEGNHWLGWSVDRLFAQAVRTVCDWARAHGYPNASVQGIEREFLEPR